MARAVPSVFRGDAYSQKVILYYQFISKESFAGRGVIFHEYIFPFANFSSIPEIFCRPFIIDNGSPFFSPIHVINNFLIQENIIQNEHAPSISPFYSLSHLGRLDEPSVSTRESVNSR